MNKVEIAKSYRKKYPEFPTLKLARIMYAENNLKFKDVEEARYKLRYIEGKTSKKPVNIKESEFYKAEARPYNPYNLPKTEAEPYEPFIMPDHKRVLILNDIHLPYHDIDALTAAFNYGKTKEPDAIFLNGDILDIHSLENALENQDFVVHTAALVSFAPKDRNQMFKVNVEGTANLVNICLEKNIKKLYPHLPIFTHLLKS
jgi:hypothetical protein